MTEHKITRTKPIATAKNGKPFQSVELDGQYWVSLWDAAIERFANETIWGEITQNGKWFNFKPDAGQNAVKSTISISKPALNTNKNAYPEQGVLKLEPGKKDNEMLKAEIVNCFKILSQLFAEWNL